MCGRWARTVTDEWTFTDEQQALIDTTESIYVEACPGAGKTKAIVERFVRRADQEPRRGIALLSFTNAVVDEARRRCGGQIDLAKSSSFVGTIDSFINHFIVGPLLTSRQNKRHTFRSVWQQVPGSVITVKGVQARAQLDWFVFTIDGAATLDPRRAPVDQAAQLRSLAAWAISRL